MFEVSFILNSKVKASTMVRDVSNDLLKEGSHIIVIEFLTEHLELIIASLHKHVLVIIAEIRVFKDLQHLDLRV